MALKVLKTCKRVGGGGGDCGGGGGDCGGGGGDCCGGGGLIKLPSAAADFWYAALIRQHAFIHRLSKQRFNVLIRPIHPGRTRTKTLKPMFAKQSWRAEPVH
jgi:hypothetical protein